MDQTIFNTPLPDRTVLAPKRTNFKYQDIHVKFILAEAGSKNSKDRKTGKFWVKLAEKFNHKFNATVYSGNLEQKYRRLMNFDYPKPVPGGALVDRRKGRVVAGCKRKNPQIIEEVQKSLDNNPSISLTQRTKNLSAVLHESVSLFLGLSSNSQELLIYRKYYLDFFNLSGSLFVLFSIAFWVISEIFYWHR